LRERVTGWLNLAIPAQDLQSGFRWRRWLLSVVELDSNGTLARVSDFAVRIGTTARCGKVKYRDPFQPPKHQVHQTTGARFVGETKSG
jgi:hypothetical protein